MTVQSASAAAAGAAAPAPAEAAVAPAGAQAHARRDSRLGVARERGALMLSIGTLASGVLAYAFNVLAARALGPEQYGPIAVLWAGMFLVSVVLFRPIEQTLSRALAERAARDQDAGPVLRSVGRITLLATGASVVAVAVAHGPLSDRLFAGQELLTLALAAGIAGYGVSYFVRGLASGIRWFDGYGTLLLADGAVRLLLALPLVVVASPAVAAGAIAAAAIGGALAPALAGAWRDRDRRRVEILTPLHGHGASSFELGHALGFAAPAAVIAAADQVLVSGGPLLVALAGGPGAAEAAGTVFAATMLVRAPVFLFQGLAASLLPNLTRFQALGDDPGFRRHLGQVTLALLAFGAAVTAAAMAVGPEVMLLLFGEGFGADRFDLGLLSAGVGLYLVAATFSQAVLARDQAGRAALVWSAAAVTFVAVELLLPGEPLERVSAAFTAAALVNATLFGLLVTRTGRGRESRAPGS